jgi:D-tyrosyl-tRNA(Tyr) deacylase
MRAIIQRVSQAEVIVDHKSTGAISKGLLVFLGVEEADDESDVKWLVRKISRMRIFADEDEKMNLSVQDVGGNILLVSQFTLHASTKKGNRPSFIQAASAEHAIKMYKSCLKKFEEELDHPIASGVFGAQMDVKLVNDGPVTIFMDSKNKE